MIFKEVTINDVDIQKQFLFTAIWQPENEERFEFNIMEERQAKAYYHNWGLKTGDIGFFAIENDKIIGLVQIRIKSSLTMNYSDLPEVVISVSPDHRGKGYGKILMEEIIKTNPYKGMRLGVHPENEVAINLYLQLGFKQYAITDNDFIQMVFKKN